MDKQSDDLRGDARDTRAADLADSRTLDTSTPNDVVGEGVGSVSGALVGAGIGAIAGPIGLVIGGIAGAAGGWWAGRSVGEALDSYSADDDASYRARYEASPSRLADRSYDDVRPAYQLGHLAAVNPDYRGRRFEQIENDLRKGWDDTARKTHGEWEHVRGYVDDAYTRHGSKHASAASTFSAQSSVAGGGLTSDPTNG